MAVDDLIGADGIVAWLQARLPKTLPTGWRRITRGTDGAAYVSPMQMTVVVSGQCEADGKRWLHVSCAYRDHLPGWQDLRGVKDLFIGKDEYAIQVLPPEAFYVRLHPNCLHLFSCIDGHPLPEFSGTLADGRRTL